MLRRKGIGRWPCHWCSHLQQSHQHRIGCFWQYDCFGLRQRADPCDFLIRSALLCSILSKDASLTFLSCSLRLCAHLREALLAFSMDKALLPSFAVLMAWQSMHLAPSSSPICAISESARSLHQVDCRGLNLLCCVVLCLSLLS